MAREFPSTVLQTVFVVKLPGQTKVEQGNFTLKAETDVVGFDVTIYDTDMYNTIMQIDTQ